MLITLFRLKGERKQQCNWAVTGCHDYLAGFVGYWGRRTHPWPIKQYSVVSFDKNLQQKVSAHTSEQIIASHYMQVRKKGGQFANNTYLMSCITFTWSMHSLIHVVRLLQAQSKIKCRSKWLQIICIGMSWLWFEHNMTGWWHSSSCGVSLPLLVSKWDVRRECYYRFHVKC